MRLWALSRYRQRGALEGHQAPRHPHPLSPLAPLSAPGQGASPAVAVPPALVPAGAPHSPGEAYPEVAAWVATLAPGTTGTASQLLPLFVAAGAPPRTRYGVAWSPGSLGVSLARLVGLDVAGRVVRRHVDRRRVSRWTVDAAPR